MIAAQTVRLETRRAFAAPAERIWDAWLDPELVGGFFFGAPHGEIVRAEREARVGGRYSFVDRRDGADVDHVGEYLELDRPRRLAFTFAVPAMWPGITRVTIDIAARPHGGCELALVQEGVHPDYAESSAGAWEFVLDRLGEAVG